MQVNNERTSTFVKVNGANHSNIDHDIRMVTCNGYIITRTKLAIGRPAPRKLDVELLTTCVNRDERNSQIGARMEPYMVSLDSATLKSSGAILSEDTRDSSNVILRHDTKSNLWKRNA